ncbi:M24 family metallopeptidase [Miltoncostaea oceani]|uniref:M24 family metallopeptidase n=1 Tax=Miltoncostaea oceani TaxID=2843216 RepID=UPI001C3D3AC1|nr:M24 family metallopeptidase [Miltoncostaea oceani]
MSASGDILIHGDTERSPVMRHEVPVAIGDPFLFMERDGRPIVLTNALERDRIAAVLPDAELLMIDQLGLFELLEGGLSRDDAELEVVARAVAAAGITRATVPGSLPVAVADRLRADGVVLDVDTPSFEARRRVKNAAELAGVRRAQEAAHRGLAAGAALLRSSRADGGRLVLDGEPLTSERVRAAVRDACAAAGAPAPPDIMVVSAWSGGGHDSGTGPLPAGLPIQIDLWPRDEESGCWADMTRTFVVGDVPPEVAALHAVVREAIEAARALIRPGVPGRALYEAAAQVIEDAGHPTLRTRAAGETLTHGFYFSLGHGVGLEVHEPPSLGLSREHDLVAGDVIAIEPGIEGIPGIGGVRLEDLILVTADGHETLTDYDYGLAP